MNIRNKNKKITGKGKQIWKRGWPSHLDLQKISNKKFWNCKIPLLEKEEETNKLIWTHITFREIAVEASTDE